MAPDGSFGWRSGRRTIDEAKRAAMEKCEENSDECEIVAVNDGEP